MGAINTLLTLVRKVVKFGPFIPISNLFLIYGKRLVSEDDARKINDRRIEKINRRILPLVEQVNSEKLSAPNPPKAVNEAIWVCWLQGEENMPPISRLCLDSIRRNAKGHQVILLTEDNFKEYVNLPDIILKQYEHGLLKPAHFADMIRIYLLAQQGGVWLDSTLLLTTPLPEEIFSVPFYSIKIEPFGGYVSKCRWSVFMLASQRGNPLFLKLSKAFELYLTNNNLFIDYFLFDHFIYLFCETDPEIRAMIDAVPMNNPEVHALSKILCEDFDEVKWQELNKETHIFKLGNRAYSPAQLADNPNSYFNQLSKN